MKIYAVFDTTQESCDIYCNTYALALSRRIEQAIFLDRDIIEFDILSVDVEVDE